ncbi:MAG: YidE/YbjL duplication [Tepidanaerobacteraceae bacterium]|jgi:putative transport protein
MERICLGIAGNEFFMLFLATCLGLMLGKIKIKNMSLGTSGALFIGLLFGMYGIKVNHVLFDFSIILFVSSVGLLASQDIEQVLKSYGLKFAALGIIITSSGAFATYVCTVVYSKTIDPHLLAGTYTGALTSSPGLAAAIEVTSNNPMIGVGHAVAYPIGVITVILFVHLFPVLFKIDISRESELYNLKVMKSKSVSRNFSTKEEFNPISLLIIAVIGIIIGKIPLTIPGMTTISLGVTGGILLSALFFGYLGYIVIKNLPTKMPKNVLTSFRELGLALFLAIVGIESGSQVIDIFQQNGYILLLIALISALSASLIGFLTGRYLWKINWIPLAGAICGGMTSTPGLGAAIDATGTDDVAAGYGATYPFALLFMVIWTIVLHKIT